MKNMWSNLISLLIASTLAIPVQDVETRQGHPTPPVSPGLPRLVLYYQTTHDSAGQPISMLPLITEKGIALTHLIVCSFHINWNQEIHLNDYPPYAPLFQVLWNETKIMKAAGVTVMGMIGGAAPGSFSTQTLDGDDATFEHYYAQLRDTIIMYELQGMDLDVEQAMSEEGIYRLVDRLRKDFGPGFTITLAPVASALHNGGNLSGFDYDELEEYLGPAINFYNAQFYNGFGSMSNTEAFDSVVGNGWDPRKIVVGQVTTPQNGGQYVEFDVLNATISDLRTEYGEIGGIMGWEYFNSKPGGLAEPWEWAQQMTQILRPFSVPRLSLTVGKAKMLKAAWKESIVGGPKNVEPNVDYMALVDS